MLGFSEILKTYFKVKTNFVGTWYAPVQMVCLKVPDTYQVLSIIMKVPGTYQVPPKNEKFFKKIQKPKKIKKSIKTCQIEFFATV